MASIDGRSQGLLLSRTVRAKRAAVQSDESRTATARTGDGALSGTLFDASRSKSQYACPGCTKWTGGVTYNVAARLSKTAIRRYSWRA